ncbi:MAG: glycosyltransferase [Burkholderiales bacterium]|nr:glycosyltransferase [Burkholderiales bacterium]MDP2399332.1 glycosyltransferase [Burkholderiales bacterium]
MNSDVRSAPLVSIVVPSYNHGRYLKEAIDSILAQDYPHIELIVIDDGSTDDSPRILASHPGRFHREYQPNQGQVATLNRGWQMSKGDIIGYLSADDILLPQSVSAAVLCLSDHPDAMLSYSDFNLLDPDSAVVRRVTTQECSYRDMAVRMLCPPGPGAFFRRSAFEKAGLWHTGYKQLLDFEYWLRLGLHGRFVRIPRVLAGYRVHPGSQTFASSSNIRPEEPVQIMEDYFANPLVPADVRAAKDEAISHALMHSGYTYFRIGEYARGCTALGRAFRLHPRNLLSLRLLRMMFNALFNTTGHRLLWWVRRMLNR